MPTDGAAAFESCLKSEKLLRVFRHWNEARGDKLMPARSDIDPQVLGPALSIVWIYERGEDGTFFCRLSGEDINRAHNQSIMKRPALEIFGPKDEFPIRQRMNFVIDTPAVLFGSMALPEKNRSVARISLPLCDNAGVPTFTFGASEYADTFLAAERNPPLTGQAYEIVVFSLPDFQPIPSHELP